MTNYPLANKTVAWYQDDYPGSNMDPNCGVIHSTEGTSLPSYEGGKTAPTYTLLPDFGNEKFKWFAHFPDEKSSRALRNLFGGVETNTANAIQLEIVGTCDPKTHADWKKRGIKHLYMPELPAWAKTEIAKFMVWAHKTHGIPIEGPGKGVVWRGYPDSYGQQPNRLTFRQWRNFKGWCGHQHVPENVHGDPGAFPIGEIFMEAEKMLKPTPAKPAREKETKPVTKYWDDLYLEIRKVEKALRGKKADEYTAAKLADIKTMKDLTKKWSSKY